MQLLLDTTGRSMCVAPGLWSLQKGTKVLLLQKAQDPGMDPRLSMDPARPIQEQSGSKLSCSGNRTHLEHVSRLC